MRKTRVLWAAGVGVAALVLAVADLRATMDDDYNAAVNGVADLLEKGDSAGAKKSAKAFADKKDFDLELLMYAFKLRTKKGIGLGSKAGVATPDGIEAKVDSIVRDGITPDNLKKEGSALARAGYVIAAVAHVARAKAPEKDVGKAKKSDWINWSEGLAKAGEEFTTASKGNNVGDLKKAANKIKQNCDSCHAVFK